MSREPAATRIEHRVPAMDCNPYLVLAAILAGGLIGMEDGPRAATAVRGAWRGACSRTPRRACPQRSPTAAEALAADARLGGVLGRRRRLLAGQPPVGVARRSTATAATPTPSPSTSCERYFEHV